MGGELHQQDKTYSQAELDAELYAARDAARRDAATNIAAQQPHQPPQQNTEGIGFDNSFLKQMQNMAGVLNAMKEFTSNPMQKAIEERVGVVSAGVIENAFDGSQQKSSSFIDTVLNSQLAYGFGQSLGGRAPEMLDSMTRNLGQNRTEQMVDNMMGSGKPNPSEDNTESPVDLLLSLDPNNPEHVAAYAETQGGLQVDVARKMLMMHQDALIKKMSPQEQHEQPIQQPEQPIQQPEQYVQSEQSIQQPERYVQSEQSIQQPEQYAQQPEQYVQPEQVYQQPQQEQEMQQQEPIQHRPTIQQEPEITKFQSHEEPIQQAEVNDITDRWEDEDEKPPNVETVEPPQDAEVVEQSEKQSDMLKSFSDEIGNVMGSMMSKIESLTTVMSNMQSEINTLKGIENAEVVDVQDSKVESISEVSNNIKDTAIEPEATSNDEDIEIEKNPTTVISKDEIRKKYRMSMKSKDNDKDNEENKEE